MISGSAVPRGAIYARAPSSGGRYQEKFLGARRRPEVDAATLAVHDGDPPPRSRFKVRGGR
jgi:hypothetical protein